jgi:hypothetical protein
MYRSACRSGVAAQDRTGDAERRGIEALRTPSLNAQQCVTPMLPVTARLT